MIASNVLFCKSLLNCLLDNSCGYTFTPVLSRQWIVEIQNIIFQLFLNCGKRMKMNLTFLFFL